MVKCIKNEVEPNLPTITIILDFYKAFELKFESITCIIDTVSRIICFSKNILDYSVLRIFELLN